jgi:Tfp pilus assembly protein PilF
VTGHLNAGNALLLRRDHRAAEREFRAALDLAPAYVPARLGLAQCLIASGRAEEGYAEIAAALREGPGLDAEIYMAVARFYVEHGEATRGAALFGELAAPRALEPARLVARGILLVRAGEEKAGERALREGLGLDPAQTEGLQEMHDLLTRRGAWADLEAILDRAMEARSDHAQAANLLALTLERSGRPQEAAALLERQIVSTPRSVPTLANLAGLQIRLGRNDRARSLLERALEIEPDHAESLVNLLVVQGKLGDLSGARETFRRSGGASGPLAAINAMAYALYLGGEHAEARALLSESLRRSPGQDQALRLLEEIDRAAGERPGRTE